MSKPHKITIQLKMGKLYLIKPLDQRAPRIIITSYRLITKKI